MSPLTRSSPASSTPAASTSRSSTPSCTTAASSAPGAPRQPPPQLHAWFDVEVIPDGLSLEAPPTTLEAHLEALERNCLQPFKELLRALANRAGAPPVSCVVADSPMSFASLAARDVGVPDDNFFTASACGLMGYMQFEQLMKRGLVPLKGTTPATAHILLVCVF
jgi:hypothetical protein